MHKKHENKTNILDFAEDRTYIEAIQNNEHILDAMRYSLFSMQSLTDKNKERFTCSYGGRQQGKSYIQSMLNERREVMEEFALKCERCSHEFKPVGKFNPGDVVACHNCKSTKLKVICLKPRTRTPITDSIMSNMALHLGSTIEEFTPEDDRLYKFNISALELLDVNELAKDLSRENPVIIVKVRGDLSRTRILIHNSIMIKSSVLKIPVPFTFHRASLDYVLFDMKDLPSDGDLDELTDSEIISEVIYFVKKVKKASIKELTTQINGKPVEIQVIKANV